MQIGGHRVRDIVLYKLLTGGDCICKCNLLCAEPAGPRLPDPVGLQSFSNREPRSAIISAKRRRQAKLRLSKRSKLSCDYSPLSFSFVCHTVWVSQPTVETHVKTVRPASRSFSATMSASACPRGAVVRVERGPESVAEFRPMYGESLLWVHVIVTTGYRSGSGRTTTSKADVDHV